MLSELIVGNWYSSALWSNVIGMNNSRNAAHFDEIGLYSFMNKKGDGDPTFRLNPAGKGLALLGSVRNSDFLGDFFIEEGVYGFAVKRRNLSNADHVFVYILNKTNSEKSIDLNLNNFTIDQSNAWSLVRGDDDFGKLEKQSISNSGLIKLQPETFTKISFVDQYSE